MITFILKAYHSPTPNIHVPYKYILLRVFVCEISDVFSTAGIQWFWSVRFSKYNFYNHKRINKFTCLFKNAHWVIVVFIQGSNIASKWFFFFQDLYGFLTYCTPPIDNTGNIAYTSCIWLKNNYTSYCPGVIHSLYVSR